MRPSKKSDPATYTKPALRDHIKEDVVKSDKGGNPGQWSARKAQLVTQEYEREGGGYKKPRNATQKSLKQWGDEHWTTTDQKKARRRGGTARYLPEKAWDKLSPAEQAKTDEKKRKGSREGKQLVQNTPAAASARKKAVKKASAPAKKKTVKNATAEKATVKKAAKRKAMRR